MRALVLRSRRLLVIGAAAVLALLHVGVLWRRAADGTLLAPLVVAQWAVAAALVLTVVALRRRGVSVFKGRCGAAFWIVVALMHGMVALPGGPGLVGALGDAPVTAAVPAGLGLVAGVLMLLAGVAIVRSRSSLPRSGSRIAAPCLAFSVGASSTIGPRAPPA